MMKSVLSVLLALAFCLAAIEIKSWVGYQGKFAKPMSVAGELAIRKVGETASFRFQALGDDKQPLRQGKLMVTLSLDGGKQIFRKDFDLSKVENGTVEVEGKLDAPGFLQGHAALAGQRDAKGRAYAATAGVAYEPEKIRAGKPAPADFDAFWKRELEAAKALPLDARKVPLPKFSKPEYDCFAVSFAAPGGRVYGFLTIPKASGKVPAVVTVPGAGPGYVSPFPPLGGNKVAVLVMNVHSYDPLTPGKTVKALYDEYRKAHGYYPQQDSSDRVKYFFHRPVLGICRAIDWLAEQPEIDGTRIGMHGSSQGGMFTLIQTGLNPRIKCAVANVPAGCDHHAALQGRRAGWPQLVSEKVPGSEVTAGYYDAAHFAARIRVPFRMVVGWADRTCAPGTDWAAFNAIASQDKQLVGIVGMGHYTPQQYKDLYTKWLVEQLLK
jgi:cephalosporin-C deacetylase-like acetyl esterase